MESIDGFAATKRWNIIISPEPYPWLNSENLPIAQDWASLLAVRQGVAFIAFRSILSKK